MSQHPRQGQTKEHREGLCGPPKQAHFPKALSRTTHPSTSSISLRLDCHWEWRGKVVPSQEESQRRQERCHSLGRGAPKTPGRTHAPGTGAELRARTCGRRHGSELPAAAIGRRAPPPEGAGRGPSEPLAPEPHGGGAAALRPPPGKAQEPPHLSQPHRVPGYFPSLRPRGPGEDVSGRDAGWANPGAETSGWNPSPASASVTRLRGARCRLHRRRRRRCSKSADTRQLP